MTNATAEKTKDESVERSRIIRNTKRMEEDFIRKNMDLNKNEMTHCKDKDNKKTTFISSKTQEQVIHKIMASTTKSVIESDRYDETDNSISRAKRIYSRKKENIKIITTIFNNGGHMVKYFKYVTKSGNVANPEIDDRRVRSFIKRLRDAYHQADIIQVDGKRMMKPPIEFLETMVKLNIFENTELVIEDFQTIK